MRKRKIGLVRSMLSTLLSPIASALSSFLPGGYSVLDPSRKVTDKQLFLGNRTTANQLLNSSLPALRTYCRNLERNNPTARAGILALDALIIGSGIDLVPETGDEKTDAIVRSAFYDWLRSVCTDGSDIYDLQHRAVHEMVTAGEWVWRLIPGDGPIPLRVLPLESEWLEDGVAAAPRDGCTIAYGIELDKYARPLAYFLCCPETYQREKVAAGSIIHGFERKRALQARGEPWLAPVIETLMNERDLVDAELKGAAITANLGIAVESESHPALDTTEYGDSDDPVHALGLGSVVRLYPGEKVHTFNHTRPSQAIAPFRQMLRGDIAAALRIPQRFLDRDVSRANYSSMRADMLDTQRLLAPVREYVGHQSIGALYRAAAPVLSAIAGKPIDPTKYRLLPDAQPYVDPVKDVRAAADAIAAGLSTHEAEIGARGGDYRQVWKQKARENAEAEALGLSLAVGESQPVQPQPEQEAEDQESLEMEAAEEAEQERARVAHARALEIARASNPPAPSIIVNAPPVNVTLPASPAITVRNEIPAQSPPTVTVQVPEAPPAA